MTNFVHNSRLKRFTSAICAVAMVMAIVVLPASATLPIPTTPSNVSLGNNFTSVEGSCTSGLRGHMSVYATGTPAAQASQDSVYAYSGTAPSTLLGHPGSGGLGATSFGLYVSVWSPAYGETADLPAGSMVSTTIPIPGLSADTSVAAMVAAIDAALDLHDTVADPNLHELAGDAVITGAGKIRVIKRFAEPGSEIWVHSTTDPDANFFVNPGFGTLGATEPPGLSLAAAAFGSNQPLFLGYPWGRYSPFDTTYKYGTVNVGYSVEASFTPLWGLEYQIPGTQYGSFVGGVQSFDSFQPSVVDTASGLYTAVQINDGPFQFILHTADRFTNLTPGYTTFDLDTVGNRLLVGPWDSRNNTETCPTLQTDGSVAATAGAVTTWTVGVPSAITTNPNNLANAYNGVSILLPKGFSVVSLPNNPALISDLSPTNFGNTTPTVVAINHTSEGDLVTISGFVKFGSLSFRLASTSPTTAMEYTGAKIWVHDVGTTMTADPSVGVNMTSDPADGTDWKPLFCPPCAPLPMDVTPDVLSTLKVAADKNRAQGYSPLTAGAFDKYGNMLDPGDVNWTQPVLTGVTDGAWTSQDPGGAFEWIWKLAKTQGLNTATITGDDARTPAVEAITGSVTIDTTGVGEPDHVVVLPTATHFPDGGTPTFQIELRDANNNPTSWLDSHPGSTDWFEVTAHSEKNAFPNGLMTASKYIWRGWARSSHTAVASTNPLFLVHTSDADGGTDWNAWPETFDIGSMPANGPDTWTIGAQHSSGSVAAAELVTVDIDAPVPGPAGVPDHVVVSAMATAPAEYALRDRLYNNKGDAYPDSAFGYAAADGTSTVILTARVVDANGDTVTSNTAGVPVTFTIPKFYKTDAILPTGHVYTTTTDANGIATAAVKSYEPTLERRTLPAPFNVRSWFTPVEVQFSSIVTPGSRSGWAYPCSSMTGFKPGYGFTYFHGAEMYAKLGETLEGVDRPDLEDESNGGPGHIDKNVVLADGSDNVTYTATVIDSGFDTPIPNWDVKFTTSLGTFADGSTSAALKTDATGHAAVVLKSSTAGDAYLRVYDRYVGLLSPYRTSYVKDVLFTDYATKYTVDEPTMTAGDRSMAQVTSWAENIKTGERVSWDEPGSHPSSGPIFNVGHVYGYDSTDTRGFGEGARVHTNDVNVTDWFVDTNNDGRADAVRFLIPALDNESGSDALRLESAGARYALIGGTYQVRTWVGDVFYNQNTITAAPARPQVDFIKTATLQAEGNQLDSSFSMVGAKFLPGQIPPGYTDSVGVYLGDITGGGATLIGQGYVGRDGVLLPSSTAWGATNRLSPGLYDITVDGLVFKNGLEIKNLFKQSWISIDGKKTGVQYLKQGLSHIVQVNAFGSAGMDLYAGSLKIAHNDGSATYRVTMPASSMDPGFHYMTAKIYWVTSDLVDNDFSSQIGSLTNPIYTTVVKLGYYIQKSLHFSSIKLTSSGRTLKLTGKVSGPAEVGGSTHFAIKVTIQKLVGGVWKTYHVTTVSASGGSYSLSYHVGSAGKYRAVVSHSDLAHPLSSSTSNSRTLK